MALFFILFPSSIEALVVNFVLPMFGPQFACVVGWTIYWSVYNMISTLETKAPIFFLVLVIHYSIIVAAQDSLYTRVH